MANNKYTNPQTDKPRKRGFYKPINAVSEIQERCKQVSKASMFAISAMGFPDKTSPVRVNMNTRQASQRVVLEEPEPAMIYTGPETPYGKRSSWHIECDHDTQLIKAIRKFPNTQYSPICYILKDLVTGKYKCIEYVSCCHLKEKNGFKMFDRISQKHEGDILPAGTTITESTSYQGDNYCAGVNFRTLFTVIPEVTEDSIIVSDWACERMAYNCVDEVEVELGENSHMLNKHGDDKNYKAFPDVGEPITNGLLCSMRENSYLSTVSEAAIPHINDKDKWADGIVADIEVMTNVEMENEQLNKYMNYSREYYSQILAFIAPLRTDPEQDDVTLLDMFARAQTYLSEETKWATKEKIINTMIKFTIVKRMIGSEGQKIVGRHGNKSVICKIVPRHLMPHTRYIDEDGKEVIEPIDVISNGLALPNRITGFVPYEAMMTHMMVRMHRHLKWMERQGKSRDEIFALAAEFVGIFKPEHGDEMRELYLDNPDLTYNDLMKNGFFIQIEPLNDVCIRDALIEAEDKYPDIFTRDEVVVKLLHRWVPRKERRYVIGHQYMWVLKQESKKKMSCISTGRTTPYDQPVKTKQFSKNLREFSDNPVRFGEYDTYNMLAGISAKDWARISTYYRGSQYEPNSVLMAHIDNKPLDITKYNKFPQIDNLKNILKFLGIKLTHDIYDYNTIGELDVKETIKFNNVDVDISIPDLRHVLILYSYYLNYQEYIGGVVDLNEFYQKMLGEKQVWGTLDEGEIRDKFNLFVHLIPVLKQLKEY